MFNVLLDTYEVMYVNNMLCETLHPDNIIAKLYGIKTRDKIFYEMNERILKHMELTRVKPRRREIL
jgi:hypothetical protein